MRLRGNIKEMERELGLPYNTVRRRLDDVVSEMGYDVGAGPGAESGDAATGQAAKRERILARLERGELDAAAAVSELESLTAEGDAP